MAQSWPWDSQIAVKKNKTKQQKNESQTVPSHDLDLKDFLSKTFTLSRQVFDIGCRLQASNSYPEIHLRIG